VGFTHVEGEGIENVYRLSDRLYSGGEPNGEAGFATLERLGIRTVLSVDGAKPNAEAARRHGMRYVHLPIGYDGIPDTNRLRIVKAAKVLEGPVFVHCHHGKHRGPAAAALIGIALEGWDGSRATTWLEAAGTSHDYAGLYATVKGFTAPTAEALAEVEDAFPERATVSGMAEAMSQIDRHWDHVRAGQSSGYRGAAGHPDVTPAHEALMLTEQLHELLRAPATRDWGEDFMSQLKASETVSTELTSALQNVTSANEDGPAKVERLLRRLNQSCKDCHAAYRNRPLPSP
jgi:protein tyrosine phosphatase (PTP) superfamily phosphohydrolase (DUF442 family)